MILIWPSTRLISASGSLTISIRFDTSLATSWFDRRADRKRRAVGNQARRVGGESDDAGSGRARPRAAPPGSAQGDDSRDRVGRCRRRRNRRRVRDRRLRGTRGLARGRSGSMVLSERSMPSGRDSRPPRATRGRVAAATAPGLDYGRLSLSRDIGRGRRSSATMSNGTQLTNKRMSRTARDQFRR